MTTANATTTQTGHRLTCYNNNHMVDMVSNKALPPSSSSFNLENGNFGDLPGIFGGSFNLIYKYLLKKGFSLNESCKYGRSGRFKLVVIGGRHYHGTAYTIFEW